MLPLKAKREELLKELEEVQKRYANLAGNLKFLETRLIEIQGSLKTIDELMTDEEKGEK